MPSNVLPAPRVRAVRVCLPAEDDGCAVHVFHSNVAGAVRYVLVTAAGVERTCADFLSSSSCRAVFPSAPGCGVTLHAVDSSGEPGRPSTSFCVRARRPSDG